MNTPGHPRDLHDTDTAARMRREGLDVPTHPWRPETGLREPATLVREDFDHLLLWAYACEIGDLTLSTDEPPMAYINSEWHRLGLRAISRQEIDGLLHGVYGANGPAQITAGEALDFAHEIILSRRQRIRFRVNATSGQTQFNTSGAMISLRAITETPKTVTELGVEHEIVEASRNVGRSQGLVLTIGPTGTGKTTLQAAFMDDLLTGTPALKIVTIEAPIEYVLSTVPGKTGVVVQSEVGRHVRTWADGVRNAMRQFPRVILLGEARDMETFNELLNASVTGHAVYSTTHAASIAGGFKRIVSMYPVAEQRGLIATLLDVVRLCVTQRLVPRVGGGRIALREFLVFDQAMRLRLATVDPDRLPTAVHAAVAERGQTLLMDARAKHAQGLISSETLHIIEAEWRDTSADQEAE